MRRLYNIKNFSLFLFLLGVSGFSVAQKITVSGLATRRVDFNIVLDPNGDYENKGYGYFKIGGPQIEYISDECYRLSIDYEITHRYLPGMYHIVANGTYRTNNQKDCGISDGNVYPFGTYQFSVAEACFDGIPCDGWSDGAVLTGGCTYGPEMVPPKITGKTEICQGQRVSLYATCEYGSPFWEHNGYYGSVLSLDPEGKTTNYKVTCKDKCKDSPDLNVTVTVHKADVKSISHSVLPRDLNIANAIHLTSAGSNGFKICVDENTSSLFTVKGTCLTNTSSQLEPPLGLEGAEADFLGGISHSFSKPGEFDSDQYLIYQHPSRLPAEKREVYSTNTLNIFKHVDGKSEKALSRSLNIYPAPVLMVHGLWSNSEAFLEMENELLKSQNPIYFSSQLLKRIDYKSTHDLPFSDNYNIIPEGLSGHLKSLRESSFAVRKVDIVAHSMGGILSRLYAQSPGYLDDIRRIIFINTPHSGSHFANFLLNSNWNPISTIFNQLILPIVSGRTSSSIRNGAVSDLKVDSFVIDIVLNGEEIKTSRFVIPYHNIVTSERISSRTNDGLPVDPRDLIGEIFDFFLDKLFNNDRHDLIVSRTSQWASSPPASGNLDYISEFSNISHTRSLTNFDVIDKTRTLLSKDTKSASYNSSGINPEDLHYSASSQNTATAHPIDISLKPNKVQRSRNSARFHLEETNRKWRIKKSKVILIDANQKVYVTRSNTESLRVDNNDYSFEFTVPETAGNVDMIFMAIDEEGEVYFRTTNFFVSNSFCESKKSGSWMDPNTWTCGRIPTATDPVVIKSNHIVTIPPGTEGLCSQIDFDTNASLKNQGKLTIKTD